MKQLISDDLIEVHEEMRYCVTIFGFWASGRPDFNSAANAEGSKFTSKDS